MSLTFEKSAGTLTHHFEITKQAPTIVASNGAKHVRSG